MTVSGWPLAVVNRATTAGRPPWMRPRTSRTSLRRSSARGAVRDLAGDQGDAAYVLGGLGETGGGLEDLLRAELLDLLLGVLQLAEHGGDLLRKLLRAALDQLLELGDDRVLPGEEVVRVDADEGLDTAHTGADGRLAEQLHQAQLGGVVDVRAAAQLLGEVADGDDADPLAVLLAELGDGALLLGLVDAS